MIDLVDITSISVVPHSYLHLPTSSAYWLRAPSGLQYTASMDPAVAPFARYRFPHAAKTKGIKVNLLGERKNKKTKAHTDYMPGNNRKQMRMQAFV